MNGIEDSECLELWLEFLRDTFEPLFWLRGIIWPLCFTLSLGNVVPPVLPDEFSLHL